MAVMGSQCVCVRQSALRGLDPRVVKSGKYIRYCTQRFEGMHISTIWMWQ